MTGHKRAVRFFQNAEYRGHVISMLGVYRRHPKAVPYKMYGMVSNKLSRLGERVRNRRRVTCNVCDWSGNAFEVLATIGYVRRNARCPNCGSMERHRAMIQKLREDKFLKPGMRLLDVGGIKPFRKILEDWGVLYFSISLGDPAMVCMDVERMGFPDESFDFIIDSHVLEYVRDYRRGMSELWRVLRSGGRMLLTEAYVHGQPQTIEFGAPNPTATFMVRHFGEDLIEFLRDAGFAVNLWDHTGQNNSRGDFFFLCEKPAVEEREIHVA
jgi:SAM-dependent methyltransferase